ncbi:hypothetical protein VPG91_27680 [Nitrospirillum amazonense]|uniref:hypothetical protein n=1 Tax=Nitrospirillum amazonense TaxID=28077 RepID=UPI002DD41B86|nr:hypothetical protein [Nitrospirillum amazonense]MEC4594809.1 hypothetical protein [Nitrospirillum amazonense]
MDIPSIIFGQFPGIFACALVITGLLILDWFLKDTPLSVPVGKTVLFALGTASLCCTLLWKALDLGYLPYKNDKINELEHQLERAEKITKDAVDQTKIATNASLHWKELGDKYKNDLNVATASCLEDRNRADALTGSWQKLQENYTNLISEQRNLKQKLATCQDNGSKISGILPCKTSNYEEWEPKEHYLTDSYYVEDSKFDLRLATKPINKYYRIFVMDHTEQTYFDVDAGDIRCFLSHHYKLLVEAPNIYGEERPLMKIRYQLR